MDGAILSRLMFVLERLWLAPGADLPEKIEFSPRSYLRITLESETVQTEEGL